MTPPDLHIAGAALRAERPEARQLVAAFRGRLYVEAAERAHQVERPALASLPRILAEPDADFFAVLPDVAVVGAKALTTVLAPAVFSFSDAPVMKALSLYREEIVQVGTANTSSSNRSCALEERDPSPSVVEPAAGLHR